MRKLISFVALAVAAAGLLYLASCGRSQELVGITIQPGTETIGASNIPVQLDAGAQVQLRALGTYIHPPVTKDITTQVTWASNDTQMFTVDSKGVLTATGLACGGSLISATLQTNTSAGGISSGGAIVTGSMTANVVCFTGNSGGGSGNPLLAITFQNPNTGTVTINPGGLVCNSPGPCGTQNYSSGTVVTLTATPTGSSTSATWLVCPSINGNVCTVDLTGTTVVTVEFS